ncbi:hypothetical protein ACWERV_36010, partial [Streptomyces sp. NPDC004031]
MRISQRMNTKGRRRIRIGPDSTAFWSSPPTLPCVSEHGKGRSAAGRLLLGFFLALVIAFVPFPGSRA